MLYYRIRKRKDMKTTKIWTIQDFKYQDTEGLVLNTVETPIEKQDIKINQGMEKLSMSKTQYMIPPLGY